MLTRRHLSEFSAVFLALILFTATGRTEWVYVQRVIDGDTFVAKDGTRIRVQGIDTPETKHPTKGKEPGGKEATALAKSFLERNYVWVEGESKDKYGRRVAKVTLRGGQSYADIVKSHGYDKKAKQVFSYDFPTAPSGKAKKTRSDYISTTPYRYNSSEFTWVDGHFKNDGTWTSGHYRSKASESSLIEVNPSYPATVATPTPSSEGKVQVKGYYRKDGTYVKPHTRSKPHR